MAQSQVVRGFGHTKNAGYVRTVLQVPAWVFHLPRKDKKQQQEAQEEDWYIEDDFWPDHGSEYMSSVRVRRGFSDEIFEIPPEGQEEEEEDYGIVSGQGWTVVEGRELGELTLDRLKLVGLLKRVMQSLQEEMRKLKEYDPTRALQRRAVEKRVVFRWYSALKAQDPQGRRLNLERRAARAIQRQFREAISNPAYRMCQKRLRREFEEFQAY
jgi:hypothetical protein